MTVSGSCLCGAVAYEIEGGLSDAGNCHCQMCRKQHGAAFATYATVDPARFRWSSGEAEVSRYQSSAESERLFCRICGSTLGFTEGGRIVSVTLGTIDGDPGVAPRSHIFVGSKASWLEITDDLTTYEEWPPNDDWG